MIPLLFGGRRSSWFRKQRLPKRAPHRRARLCLEELESRALMSAGWTASPALTNVTPLASSTPAVYYSPSQIQTAYGFSSVYSTNKLTGAGETIAIVDAYDDPYISSELSKFDKQFGISAPPSFSKVMVGGTARFNLGWAMEIALDVEWAHAIAPGANILLVEATSSSDTALMNAVTYASSHANVVSMSWGGSEFSGETAYDSTFSKSGVVFVAAAGDNGTANGPEWPSVSPNVVGVGGTTLYLNSDNTRSSESGWSGGGGGPSTVESEPSYQAKVETSKVRTAPDVGYIADPNTGVLVYSLGGWWSFGGTSIGAPQWSGLFALADQGRGSGNALSNVGPLLYSSSFTNDFYDITSGNNGFPAGTGYDEVTGLGTPNASKLVPDLVNASTTSNAAATKTSGSGKSSGSFGFRFDGIVIGGPTPGTDNATLASILATRPADSASTPAPQTPLTTVDSVWLTETNEAPRMDTLRKDDALRDVSRLLQRGSPSSVEVNDDIDVSAVQTDDGASE
jgi:subtilase family serine protease